MDGRPDGRPSLYLQQCFVFVFILCTPLHSNLWVIFFNANKILSSPPYFFHTRGRPSHMISPLSLDCAWTKARTIHEDKKEAACSANWAKHRDREMACKSTQIRYTLHSKASSDQITYHQQKQSKANPIWFLSYLLSHLCTFWIWSLPPSPSLSLSLSHCSAACCCCFLGQSKAEENVLSNGQLSLSMQRFKRRTLPHTTLTLVLHWAFLSLPSQFSLFCY